jgi:hypothetical protein
MAISSLSIAFATFLFLNLISSVQPSSTVSIVGGSGYISERTCAQNCVWHVGVSDDLITYLGCSNDGGWQNSCYCRADLASSASYFLTSCVNKACSTNAVDLQGAVSVYQSYCAAAEGTPVPAPVSNAATTTLGPPSSPVETVIVVTTVISTSAAGSLSSTESREFRQLVAYALPLLFSIVLALC